MEKDIYLGDAVYAEFDGSGVWLRLNDHRSPRLIYLEPTVLGSLNDFFQGWVKELEGE